MNRRTKAAVAVAATGLAFVANTGTAMAAGPGGVEACPSGAFCLYYNSAANGWGSFTNFTPTTPNTIFYLNTLTFGHYANGSGYGQTLYHNVAAAVNNTGDAWKIHTDTGFDQRSVPGEADDFVPGIKNMEVWLEDQGPF